MPIEKFTHEGRTGCARFVSAAIGGPGGRLQADYQRGGKGQLQPDDQTLCGHLPRAGQNS